MKLGIVVLCNDSGLGAQTRRLTYMLKPESILAIDSTGFSKNKAQHFNWYDNFTGYKISGFPTTREYSVFMRGLTHVLVCENPLNFQMLTLAKQTGVKVYIQSNYEFCDHLDKQIELPHKFLMPSYWKVEEMKKIFGHDKVQHLPPPIDPNEFKEARDINFAREGKPRFLHIVGTLAVNDRNGTLDLIKSVQVSKSDFELIIRSQHDLPQEYMINDRRIKYVIENTPNAQDMYKNFDALILPRKYGGLSLTTNEALMSGLPVIMTDISPNSRLLPRKWLVRAVKTGEFKTRTQIDICSVNVTDLRNKVDWLCNQNLDDMKSEAFMIGHENFSDSILKSRYQEVFGE